MKPYHGLRIFKNKGDLQFEEAYFHPMNGASGLVIGEFSELGNRDIAVISYFPSKDGEHSNNSLFFEQMQGFEYKVKSLPSLGKWSFLTISKGYISNETKPDILLGRFDFKSLHAFPGVKWMPFIILKNDP